MCLHPNEIRDYLARAPRRFHFNGMRMVNNTAARFAWLASIASGTLDQRINRRAGIADDYKPFKYPVYSSQKRQHRRQLIKLYGRGRNGYVYQHGI
jgi:hypothetical protein